MIGVIVVVVFTLPFIVLLLAIMFYREPRYCPRCLSTKRESYKGHCTVFPNDWTDYCKDCGKYLDGVKPDGLY